jgi:hypothetical protein
VASTVPELKNEILKATTTTTTTTIIIIIIIIIQAFS